MRVLVTGGAGYIGSVVSEQLVKDDHEVVVYDSLYKGHRDAVVAGARLVEADLRDHERDPGERHVRDLEAQRDLVVGEVVALQGERIARPLDRGHARARAAHDRRRREVAGHRPDAGRIDAGGDIDLDRQGIELVVVLVGTAVVHRERDLLTALAGDRGSTGNRDMSRCERRNEQYEPCKARQPHRASGPRATPAIERVQNHREQRGRTRF